MFSGLYIYRNILIEDGNTYLLEGNKKQAAVSWRKACKLRSGMGCFNAARYGGYKDEKKALELCKKSCSLGYEPGCNVLAIVDILLNKK